MWTAMRNNIYAELRVVIFALLCFSVQCQNCTYWNYPGYGYGMVSWPNTCTECDDADQSPIDLTMAYVQSPPYSELADLRVPLTVSPNADWTSASFAVENNGQKLTLTFGTLQIKVTGLGLPGTYIVQEAHWHWGSASLVGSEHTRNGAAYAMECHIVLYNSAFNDYAHSVSEEDGIAVIGIWYDEEPANTDTPVLTPFLSVLSSISNAGQSVNIPGFNLMNLFPNSTFPFFRYNGSFTTPACMENVIWTVIDNPIPVSTNQMNQLRSSLYFSDLFGYGALPMVNNFRMLQLLNGRDVYYVSAATAVSRGLCSIFFLQLSVLLLSSSHSCLADFLL